MRVLVLTLMFAGCLLAQDKPPFEWRVSGDDVASFKMELVLNEKPDQSSAKACVLSYAALTDNRKATADMMKAVGAKWDAAVRSSVADHESELLTPEAIKAIRNAASSAGFESRFSATEVAAQTVDGEVTLVETTQVVEIPYKELGSDKVLYQKQQVRLRFACVKVGAAWRIRGIERHVLDEEGTPRDGKAPMKWAPDSGLLPVIMYALKQDAGRADTPDSIRDTPEAAARSLFESLIVRRDALTESVRAKGLAAWLGEVKPLFTDEFVKAQDGQADDWLKQKPAATAREVDIVTDNPDGTRTVRFKPVDFYSGAVEVRVQRDGKLWKVCGGGFYSPGRDEKGQAIWKYQPEPDLYSLKWR